MQGIRVTPDQLQSLASEVDGRSTDIEETLTTLRSRVLPLTGGEWAGHAAREFEALWIQWQRSAGELNAALRGISRLLNRAGAAYAQAEESIAASFRQ